MHATYLQWLHDTLMIMNTPKLMKDQAQDLWFVKYVAIVWPCMQASFSTGHHYKDALILILELPCTKIGLRAVGSNFSVVRPTSCKTVCIENLG